MSSTPIANLFKRVRPAAGRVGLNTMATSIPKQRVQYSMRDAKTKNIQVSEAAMIDKVLRKQLHRRQPPASVSARRDDIRQQDILRRRTIHFSIDTRLPSFSRTGKLSKFTSVSDWLAKMLASEVQIRKIIMVELSAASPDIDAALHAAVNIQQDLGLFKSVDSVTDIFVACLRKVAPVLLLIEEHTLKTVKDWDFFWSVYRYLTTEAEWGRLRDELYNLYQVLEHVVAFTKLKISVETRVSTVRYNRFMDLSEYHTCGPDSFDIEMVDIEMEDRSVPSEMPASIPAIPGVTPVMQSVPDIDMSDSPPAAALSMTPATSSSAMSSSGASPTSASVPPAAASPFATPAPQFGAASHASTKFQPCRSRPVQADPAPAAPAPVAPVAPAPAAPVSQPPAPAQPSGTASPTNTNFQTFPPRPSQAAPAQAVPAPAQAVPVSQSSAPAQLPAASSHSSTPFTSFGSRPKQPWGPK